MSVCCRPLLSRRLQARKHKELEAAGALPPPAPAAAATPAAAPDAAATPAAGATEHAMLPARATLRQARQAWIELLSRARMFVRLRRAGAAPDGLPAAAGGLGAVGGAAAPAATLSGPAPLLPLSSDDMKRLAALTSLEMTIQLRGGEEAVARRGCIGQDRHGNRCAPPTHLGSPLTGAHLQPVWTPASPLPACARRRRRSRIRGPGR